MLQSCKNLNKFKFVALVRIFLDAGVHPDLAIDTDDGNTSLHFAAKIIDRKLGEVAGRLLVEFGARVHKKTKLEKRPWTSGSSSTS